MHGFHHVANRCDASNLLLFNDYARRSNCERQKVVTADLRDAAKSLVTIRSWGASDSEMTWIGALEGGVTYIIGWASEKSAEAKTIRRILAWGDSLFLSRKPTDWRRFPTVTLWIGDPPLRRATQAFPIGPMFEESFLVGVAVAVKIACWGRFGSRRAQGDRVAERRRCGRSAPTRSVISAVVVSLK